MLDLIFIAFPFSVPESCVRFDWEPDYSPQRAEPVLMLDLIFIAFPFSVLESCARFDWEPDYSPQRAEPVLMLDLIFIAVSPFFCLSGCFQPLTLV